MGPRRLAPVLWESVRHHERDVQPGRGVPGERLPHVGGRAEFELRDSAERDVHYQKGLEVVHVSRVSAERLEQEEFTYLDEYVGFESTLFVPSIVDKENFILRHLVFFNRANTVRWLDLVQIIECLYFLEYLFLYIWCNSDLKKSGPSLLGLSYVSSKTFSIAY